MNRFVISLSLNAAEAIFVPLPVFTCYIILDEFWTSLQVSVNPSVSEEYCELCSLPISIVLAYHAIFRCMTSCETETKYEEHYVTNESNGGKKVKLYTES